VIKINYSGVLYMHNSGERASLALILALIWS